MRARGARWLLPWALLWIAGCAQARAEGPGAQTIYRYKNDQGRLVFVNGLQRVPEKHRARARAMDLSHISLNQKLGGELKAEVERQLERLEQQRQREQQQQRQATAGGRCVPRITASGSSNSSWLQELWHRHDYLVVISAFLLALLIATPFMVKRIQPERWARLLMFVVPLLVVVTLMSYAAVTTSQAVRGARDNIQRCPPVGTVDPLSRGVQESDRKALMELKKALWQEQQAPAP